MCEGGETRRAAGWRAPCERCAGRGWIRPSGFVDGRDWPIRCACEGRDFSIYLVAKAIASSRSEIDALRGAIRRLVLGQGVRPETAAHVLDRLMSSGLVAA